MYTSDYYEAQMSLLYNVVERLNRKVNTPIMICAESKDSSEHSACRYLNCDILCGEEFIKQSVKEVLVHTLLNGVVLELDKDIYFINKLTGKVELVLPNHIYLRKLSKHDGDVHINLLNEEDLLEYTVIIRNKNFNIKHVERSGGVR